MMRNRITFIKPRLETLTGGESQITSVPTKLLLRHRDSQLSKTVRGADR